MKLMTQDLFTCRHHPTDKLVASLIRLSGTRSGVNSEGLDGDRTADLVSSEGGNGEKSERPGEAIRSPQLAGC
ncbi:hypothetical protein K2Y11_05925 [bacterium]|nr:hypothetical protein [bacterium]